MASRRSQGTGGGTRSGGSGGSRAPAHNANPRGLGGLAIALVVVVVAIMVLFRLRSRGGAAEPPAGAAGDRIIAAVTSVPAATLDAVGAGAGLTPPVALPEAVPLLLLDGKPEVLSVGAEFCPYCAAERWSLAIALSRFGTFHGLGLTSSAADDVFPSTPTLSFHGSTYTSAYVSFVSVETATNKRAAGGRGYEPLENMTLDQSRLLQTYDVAPYTDSPGSIPFVLVGNKFVISGSTYSPEFLKGMTWQQIADALYDARSPIAPEVLGAANVITAALCRATGSQPANVCASPGVTASAATLKVK